MKEYTPVTEQEDFIGKAVVNAAFRVHKALGLGLLERVYEVCMEYELKKVGFKVKRQVDIPIMYDNLIFEEGLRLDLLVEDLVIVEMKAVDLVNPVWQAQVMSHLKLTNRKLGYLINFNVALIKDGIKRIVM